MKIPRTFMIFAAAALMLSACEYEWIEPDVPPVPDVVSFSADVIPIFQNDCMPCHAAGLSEPDLSAEGAYNALTTEGYVNTEDPASSLIYTSMKSGSMKSYASPGTPEIILKWIEQGAENN